MPYEYSAKDVGPGWDKIVQPLIDRAKDEGVVITQIKEKFGGLRFYVGHASEEFHNAIGAAEDESFKTCEECGAPGAVINTNGWLRTACAEHAKPKSRY